MFINYHELKDAMEANHLLRITYLDAKGKQTIRIIEPYEVKENKLFGYCTNKRAIRAFRLDRIKSIDRLNDTFTPRFPVQTGTL